MKKTQYFYESKTRFYDIEIEKTKRFFFNSVTNALMNPDTKKEEEMYEYDPEDIKDSKEHLINIDVNLSEKDKLFFNIWNTFVSNR